MTQSTHVCQVPVDLRLDTDELRCAEDIRALLEAGGMAVQKHWSSARLVDTRT